MLNKARITNTRQVGSARVSEISNFTGISSSFEVPAYPFITIDNILPDMEEIVQTLLEEIIQEIAIKPILKD